MNTLLSKLSPGITTMIRTDHAHVMAAFHKFRPDASAGTRRALADLVCRAIEVHAQLEEEIFYPAMRALGNEPAIDEKSVPEHAEMKRLIALLREGDPTDAAFDANLMALMREVMHHVADEETTLLPDAERLMPERLSELGAEMTKRRLQLLRPHAAEVAMDTVRTMPAATLLVMAGALLAGGLVARRAMASRH